MPSVSTFDTYDQLKQATEGEQTPFIYAHWDGTRETEAKVKAETGATIRCIPLPNQGFGSGHTLVGNMNAFQFLRFERCRRPGLEEQ